MTLKEILEKAKKFLPEIPPPPHPLEKIMNDKIREEEIKAIVVILTPKTYEEKLKKMKLPEGVERDVKWFVKQSIEHRKIGSIFWQRIIFITLPEETAEAREVLVILAHEAAHAKLPDECLRVLYKKALEVDALLRGRSLALKWNVEKEYLTRFAKYLQAIEEIPAI